MKFKSKRCEERMLLLHPVLIMIFSDLFWFARMRYNKDIIVTDTVSTASEDAALGRVSDSHQRGLCLDWSVRNFETHEVLDLVNYINNKPEYQRYKYLSNSGVKRIAYFHDNGNGPHVHMGINKKLQNNIIDVNNL